ncbi:MAG: phosphate acetyltransferase [Arenicellales bacterium WSBS_2016_MAG_OTU3]
MLEQLLQRKSSRRVLLPESEDVRILQAANEIKKRGIAVPVLVGDVEVVAEKLWQQSLPADAFEIISPQSHPDFKQIASVYEGSRKRVTPEQAQQIASRPLYFAAAMLRVGEADALIAGAVNATAEVITAGLRGVGLAPGIKTASSFFLMLWPEAGEHRPDTLIYADCALNVDPNPAQLADITIASAASAARLLADNPRIAMLSFSTKGSAKHPHVDKVTQALEIVKQRNPELIIDGELQADSALVAAVAEKKFKSGSDVAGKANVLIFPDLDAGNIAYKITQYLAGARAIGPILQGFAKPVSDLSRGASVDDIVTTTAVTLALAE